MDASTTQTPQSGPQAPQSDAQAQLAEPKNQLAEIKHQLASMRGANLHNHDPRQFVYLEALLRRAQEQRDSVASLLHQKLKGKLEEYCQALQSTQQQSQDILDNIRQGFPEELSQAEGLFAEQRLPELGRLWNKLRRSDDLSSDYFANLMELLDGAEKQLQERLANEAEQVAEQSDDDDKDAEAAASSLCEPTAEEDSEAQPAGRTRVSAPSGDQLRELKALPTLRESWAKLNAEKLVMRSINEGPENAGPLNPHYLAIRSLSNMRDLSPHYLNRFVSYMETLLWLEKAGIERSPVKKKATKAGKNSGKRGGRR